MKKALFLKIKEALFSVMPVAMIVVILNLTPLVNFTGEEIAVFVVSAIFLIIGIGLFNLGADLAMTPMGEHVGGGLSKTGNLKLLFFVCFVMGLAITIAEPDLSVLASQVSDVINGTLLIVVVGIGVGLFLTLSIIKIVFRQSLSAMLMFFYLVLFAFTALVAVLGNDGFLSLAFDSGGVTTGPITVPFVMALGVGIAGTLGDKNDRGNSFGLVAFCSVGPVIAVMILGATIRSDITYAIPDYSMQAHLGENFLPTLLSVMKEVGVALALVVVFFFILQFTCLKLPKSRIYQIIVGIFYTFFGLVVFLTAVSVGFMPIGYKMGQELAKNPDVVIVVVAFVLGMVVVLAEPAIHVLNNQVEEVTGGMVKKTSMLVALSLGVGISIALSIIRVIFDFSILFYLIPGYCISFALSFFVPKLYTAIAFDSGGVASGPLTSSFILPFVIGVCAVLQGESKILTDAFGLVAMVAMTPLITIQILGFRAVVANKMRESIAMKRILDADDEQIINFM